MVLTGGMALIAQQPANTISFYEVVLHEIGHGIGVLSLVSINDGTEFFDIDDAYSRNLYDEQTAKFMTNMNRKGLHI